MHLELSGQIQTHKSVMACMRSTNKKTVAQNHRCPNYGLRPAKGTWRYVMLAKYQLIELNTQIKILH